MRYRANDVFFARASAAFCADLLSFLAAASLAWMLFSPPFPPVSFASAALVGWLGAFLVLHFFDLYSAKALGDGATSVTNTVATVSTVAGTFGVLHFAAPLPPDLLKCAAQTAAIFFPIQVASRSLYRRLILSRPERVLILGVSDLGRATTRFINRHPGLGMTVVGVLSDAEDDWGSQVEGAPVLGPLHLMEKVLTEERIHRVVVASKRRGEEFPADALLAAKVRGVRVDSGVSFYERATGRVYLRDLRSSYLIFSDGFRMGRARAALKRLLDLTVALHGLVLAAPLLLVATIAIKLDSRGPVLFRQLRQGQQGSPFVLYKLRTMCCDAERDTGPVWAGDHDKRITRVGKLLRRCRMDEVPQLWNVLRGEMSAVGPRPERPEFVDSLSDRYPLFRLRSAVKPGITGWAQVSRGYVADAYAYEDKLCLDLFYVKNGSFWMDLLVLWRTVKTVLRMGGR